MRTPQHLFLTVAFLTGSALALDSHAQVAPAAPTPAFSSLFGFVRDTVGNPVGGAEIILRDGGRDIRIARAGNRGDFLLADVPSGTYMVWFRRLGFSSIDYNWAARTGKRDTVRVTLAAVPHGLDPVIVREREDRMLSGTGSVIGLVVDTLGNPVADASIDLIGADRGGNSRANGGFLFRPLRTGPYVVRVRKIGYEPQFVTMTLQTNEERELVVRLHPLPTMLDAVQVLAQSGYTAASQWAQEDLDRRMRWHSPRSIVLGPDEMLQFKGGALDLVARAYGVEVLERMKTRRAWVRRLDPAGTSAEFKQTTIEGDACVLVNGLTNVQRPLSSWAVDDVELVEVYPSGAEETGTVSFRMHSSCGVKNDGSHKTWYVLWFKGRR